MTFLTSFLRNSYTCYMTRQSRSSFYRRKTWVPFHESLCRVIMNHL
jgi:hypothetical protein